jgi:hypothetical protein
LCRDFPDLHVGTIHTYQGKESDIILLVLGGNVLNVFKEGALNWAASRPNLLNVAVTRARKRMDPSVLPGAGPMAPCQVGHDRISCVGNYNRPRCIFSSIAGPISSSIAS